MKLVQRLSGLLMELCRTTKMVSLGSILDQTTELYIKLNRGRIIIHKGKQVVQIESKERTVTYS